MGTILAIIGIYFALGLAFAFPFALKGAPKIDPGASGTGIGFRLLLIPGSAIFWPLLAWRWKSGRTGPPTESNTHRRKAARSKPEDAPQ